MCDIHATIVLFSSDVAVELNVVMSFGELLFTKRVLTSMQSRMIDILYVAHARP
jgi:hypothetical protein